MVQIYLSRQLCVLHGHPQGEQEQGTLNKDEEDAALTCPTDIPDGGSKELFTLDAEGRTLRASTPLLTGGPLLGFSTYGAVHQLLCVSAAGMDAMDEKVKGVIFPTIERSFMPSTTQLASGEMQLHPIASGEPKTCRWTSPRSGNHFSDHGQRNSPCSTPRSGNHCSDHGRRNSPCSTPRSGNHFSDHGQRNSPCSTRRSWDALFDNDQGTCVRWSTSWGDVWRLSASLVLKLTNLPGLICLRLQVYSDVMLLVVFCTLGLVTPLVSLSTPRGICCP